MAALARHEVAPIEVLATDMLTARPTRAPALELEHQTMESLVRTMTGQPARFVPELVNAALRLCNAGSAGLSLLESLPDGQQIFRWVSLAGVCEPYIGGFTPRNWSPCGLCLDQQRPILVSYPARAFTYFNELKEPIVEGLVIPVNYAGEDLGTIWVVSHDAARQFDGEDVRIMTTIAHFTAVALRLQAVR